MRACDLGWIERDNRRMFLRVVDNPIKGKDTVRVIYLIQTQKEIILHNSLLKGTNLLFHLITK